MRGFPCNQSLVAAQIAYPFLERTGKGSMKDLLAFSFGVGFGRGHKREEEI
jgi:hypothetical protein